VTAQSLAGSPTQELGVPVGVKLLASIHPVQNMRIAQIAPLAESVPPKLYGGTERVISWLTEELLALGHDVTLFASGDSTTRAALVPVIRRAIRLSRPRPEPFPAYALLLDALAHAASDFDVVHCHTDWLHLPLLDHIGVPHLTTIHNRLDTPDLPPVISRFPHAPLISISDHHRTPLPSANWLGTVYHGMPVDTLQPRYERGQYLAFLGRLTKEKGPEVAIRLARAAQIPLRMAAKIPRLETRYYKERLQPIIDGQQVQLVGELDDAAKGEFLRHASALLFPIDWPEPFGLVMIEAMACGTPAIAFRRGSVPEVIDDGVTGFIVDNEEQAVAAIHRIGELDRRRVRAAFEQRFTARRMAEDYVRHYESLLRNETRQTLEPVRMLNVVDGFAASSQD
jgi:glycosyltransferase involved in cell wall biosynthesis